MIKKQNIKSMACLVEKGLLGRLFMNNPNPSFSRNMFTSTNNNSCDCSKPSFGNIGLSLKGCVGDFRDKVPNLNSEDVFGFHKTRAFALSHHPISEDKIIGSGVSDLNIFDDRSLPHKLVVAVDVDEVLGNFVSALNRFIEDRYSSSHSVSEYHVYEFYKIWKCSRDEADIRVHEFFKSCYFKDGIYPIPGAQKTLNKLSRFCKLSVVTSRQNVIKDHTLEWLEKHYSGLFDEIHFGNHFALDGESKPKSEICKSMGAKVLIDDNPRYAIECAEVGISVLLFDYENSYPWCKSGSNSEHPLVTKVHNWEEVEQQLVSWILSSHL